MRYYSSNISCPDCGIQSVHCGEEQCKPGHFFGPHIRDHYLIHYIVSGKGIFEINGITYNLKAGDIFFIMPRIITYYCADPKDPWTYKWVGISSKNLDNIFSAAGLNTESPVAHVGKNIENAIDRIIATIKSGDDPQLKLAAYAYNFLDELVKRNGRTEIHKDEGRRYIEFSIGYIHNYAYKKITVDELAKKVNIDRSYLTFLFKKHIGISPKQYILKTKMKTACEYLELTNYDITQIASSVGYEDLFVFSRAFKKIIGTSPTEYRKRHK